MNRSKAKADKVEKFQRRISTLQSELESREKIIDSKEETIESLRNHKNNIQDSKERLEEENAELKQKVYHYRKERKNEIVTGLGSGYVISSSIWGYVSGNFLWTITGAITGGVLLYHLKNSWLGD